MTDALPRYRVTKLFVSGTALERRAAVGNSPVHENETVSV